MASRARAGLAARVRRLVPPLTGRLTERRLHVHTPSSRTSCRASATRPGRNDRPRLAAGSAGLLTVAAGAALMTWALAAHYQAAPQGWALDSRLTPAYLLRRGPYRFSRNPMYAGEA